ncbi:hypothetical protein LF252_18295 [Hymenobacter sp. BT728]|nr:hypothetical protein [Hymenobacter pini]
MPDPLFFLDRTVATRRVQEALQSQGVSFLAHPHEFQPDTPDTEWLPAITARGGFVLTQERRIGFNPLEQQALLASGVGAFIIVAKDLTGAALADCLVRALPRMQRFARRQARPFLAKVYVDGSVQRLA